MTEKIKANGKSRHELYQHLTKAKDSGGKAGPVMWNFEKFLVLAGGEMRRFCPQVKPDTEEIANLIQN